MNVLVAFATTEGQTRKIVHESAIRIRDCGHKVQLYDTATFAELKPSDFNAVILAASIHHGYHQDSLIDFAIAHREQLKARPNAFISVSLSAVLEQEKAEAQRYVDEFVIATGWQPRKILKLGGALRLSTYDYFQEQIVKLVVLKRSCPETTQADHEFTDWRTLSQFVDEFLEMASLERRGVGAFKKLRN
jgi:menaquinone-dependent protoporphyrinogen oxidase